jgi:hypothetical protein
VTAVLTAIIAVALLLFLLTSGFAVVFVYFPRWLMHRYELTARTRMIAYFAVVGLLVPVAFTCKYLATRTEIVTDAVYLWPTALILMDLDGHPSLPAIVGNFALAILTNVGLYVWLGIFAAWIRRGFHKTNLEA